MCYFTPLKGFFFTFPSRYYFAIGHSGVFSLTRWSSLIHTGFHVPHVTWDKISIGFEAYTRFYSLNYRTITFYGTGISCFIYLNLVFMYPPTTPIEQKLDWFRLVPLRSPLLRESLLLSFPPATKMFQFTGFSLFYL